MANKQSVKESPIKAIREKLRRCSVRQAALLARSVGRLTSCDARLCLEYRAKDRQRARRHRPAALPLGMPELAGAVHRFRSCPPALPLGMAG